MSDDPMDRLRGIEQARASAEMRSLLQRATETAERMADLAATAVRGHGALARERDALRHERDNMRIERDLAYARTDDLANETQALRIEREALRSEVHALRMRLAQDEAATQPPAVA